MSYIVEATLIKGESIVYRTKLHWAIFLWPMFWLVLTILNLPALITADPGTIDTGPATFFALIALITGTYEQTKFKWSEFVITNKRVVVKYRVVGAKSLEILLNNIESIMVNQGMLGNILGYGTITIIGTGGTKHRYHKINAPLKFRKIVQEQVASARDSQ
jgi:uncharacterized membrane protein YdbT with pleckstrin-like domain